MTKKKRILIIGICVAIALVLLVPIPIRYDDGGTVKYQAILYSVTNYRKPDSYYDPESGTSYYDFEEWVKIEILGIEVYDGHRK